MSKSFAVRTDLDFRTLRARLDVGLVGDELAALRVCETSQRQICGTWTLNGDHFDVAWENGKTTTIKIEQFDNDLVLLDRTESTPQGDMKATYSGHISGNKIEGGTVSWTWSGGSRSGTWTASW